MTEVFPWSPRVRSSGDTQPNVLSSQFGNGYSQRLPVGINNLAATWSVSFTGPRSILSPFRTSSSGNPETRFSILRAESF
uniref:phage tail protein n=1 Tax=Pseudomonas sp. G.S.17 TaxID=3137451 RepID=UPI004053E93E